MKCPIDNEALVMTERSGVEIDYCPKCRGVWLDRGELDKIIERGAAPSPPQHQRPPEPPRSPDHRYDEHHGRKPYYKKRESFLSDLFDF